jgi:gas vesicle protein
MNDRPGYNGTQLLLAFLAGALVGTTVALLSAPQSGRESRGAIRDWARDAGGTATRLPEALGHAYRQATGAAKKAFSEALSDRGEEPGR